MPHENNEKIEKLKCVALGMEPDEIIEIDDKQHGDKLTELEQRIFHLTNGLDNLFKMVKDLRDDLNKEHDRIISELIEKKKSERKAEIPEGTVLYGSTHGLNYFLQVKDGAFWVGDKRYDSLSAAAEAVSGVRRSGWTFWKLPDGRTVKEVFKDAIPTKQEVQQNDAA